MFVESALKRSEDCDEVIRGRHRLKACEMDVVRQRILHGDGLLRVLEVRDGLLDGGRHGDGGER